MSKVRGLTDDEKLDLAIRLLKEAVNNASAVDVSEETTIGLPWPTHRLTVTWYERETK